MIKKELLLLTLGIGAACTGYCLFVFSVQAAVSYAAGVAFSFLYLQLLYQHADNMSRDSVPKIFRQKKIKKIGIRSEDLKDSMERSVRGSGIALSSPRLVIHATIFGLWAVSHGYSTTDFFDFQKTRKGSSKHTREIKQCARRKSLAAFGTELKEGKRRSTRERIQPLEFWKGERQLYGRIHESLITVIGLKYLSPSKELGRATFKVKSYVSDEYKEIVELSALH